MSKSTIKKNTSCISSMLTLLSYSKNTLSYNRFERQNAGFSLVELIMVIIILGIVGTSTVQYFSLGAQIYADATGRDKVVAQARFLLARLTRELRHSAPNSIRLSCDNTAGNMCNTSVQCLEFTPFKQSGVYTNNLHLDTNISGDITLVDLETSPVVNDWLNVYALTANDVYTITNQKRRKLLSITEGVLTTDPDIWSVEFGFLSTSPSKRIYVLDAPVMYCVESGSLYRYSGHGFSNSSVMYTPNSSHVLNDSLSTRGVIMGKFIQNNLLTPSVNDPAFFNYNNASLTRNSVVNINVLMSFDNVEMISLNHEIHLPNVP